MATKTAKTKTTSWGFDLKNIDSAIRPQDDFYRYANGGWIKNNTIPKDESRWGSFITLRFNTEQQLKAIVEGLLKKKYKKGSREQMIADFYRSALDFKRRNALGAKPLDNWRREIRAIDTRERLLGTIGLMHRQGITVPWEFFLDQDSKNSKRFLLHLTQDGIGMPEREYYLSDSHEHKRVRDAYKLYIAKMLTLAGIQKNIVSKMAATVLAIETKLARASMTKEDARDTEKVYNKRTVAALQREVPEVNWSSYFSAIGAGGISDLVVCQPEFFKEVGKMLHGISLEDWKMYPEWHFINECAPLLSEKFVAASFSFYGTTLTGTKHMRAPWRRGLGATNGSLGEALGKIYVEKHFPTEAKRRMDSLVGDLVAAYEKRIKALDWMSAATKKKALQKLHIIRAKIGYPSKYDTYKGVSIDAKTYFNNVLATYEHAHKKSMRRLRKPVDTKEWVTVPQVVNAFFNYNMNDITFPAAILQPPFFNFHGDDAVNYGAIGAVIGHEITHGFDDQGSKFDSHGNLKSWWSKQDRSHFEKRAEVLVEQFNAYEVSGGVHANGKLTLGENIADFGGVLMAYDAYQTRLKKTGRKVLNGFTPEQRFFLGFAQAECEISRPEVAKLLALIDVHADSPLRVNGPASNMDAFYEAFNVKKGDKLYREPSKRAKIW